MFKDKKTWPVLLVCGAIIVLLAAIWIPELLPERIVDQPGTRINMSAKAAMEWVKDKPVAFVQLSFPACPACQAASPTLEKLIAEYELHAAYVDIKQPENMWLAEKMNLEATPTIWAFHYGEPVGPPVVGNIGEDAFRAFFLKHLEQAANKET